MFDLRYLSIRKKLTLIIMTTVLVAVGMLSAIFLGFEYVSTKQGIQREYTTTANIIANQSGAALVFRDTAGLQEILGSLSLDGNISLACVYHIDEGLLATFSKYGTASCPVNPRPNSGSFQAGRYVQNVPIVVDGQVEGHLYLETSLDRFYDELYLTLLFIVIVAVTICFFGYLFSSQLQHFISRPLFSLIHTTTRISETGDYSLRAQRTSSDEIGDLVTAFNDMLETIQKQSIQIMKDAEELEDKVEERTHQLAVANANLENSLKKLAVSNNELEAFSYSVSHDLRAPLRAIDGFAQALDEDYGDQMDDTARNYLQRIRAASQKMGMLIQTLLTLSRVSRRTLEPKRISLSDIASRICEQLRLLEPARDVRVIISPDIEAIADPDLMEVVLENLLNNAWKYTAQKSPALIEFGRLSWNTPGDEPVTVYYVRDNGAGFDMRYARDLFAAFKRLHSAEEFEGTGIGLATVARIIHRHHGEIWATAEIGQGAQFFFTLNTPRPEGFSPDFPADHH